jgi:YrbI family 3-deoxy-D-manno-octulosonate 8-phosphate phosphatase
MASRRTRWPDIRHIHTIVFDFDGVFTDNKVYVTDEGHEAVCCDRADGLAIDFLRRHRARHAPDLEFFVVSTERNPVVALRAEKLQLDCHQNIGDKLEFLEQHLRRRHADDEDPFAGLVYLGNDLNDLPVLERAGFSVVPNDAHPRVKRVADAVLPQNGGQGFVRAAVERLLGLEQMSSEEIHELVSNR